MSKLQPSGCTRHPPNRTQYTCGSSVVAGRNIGDVFAYGNINAALLARNTPGVAGGGEIANVQAVSNIDGTLLAESKIDTVTASGAIGATLIAPVVETPTANDTELAQTTPPSLPASVKAEILAEAALARDAVFADYDTLAQQLIDLDADVAQSLATAAGVIALNLFRSHLRLGAVNREVD